MKHYNEHGLTLLEVLVSMLVLSIGVLGLAPLVVLSMDGNNISNDMMIVSSLAKNVIENFENLSTLPAMPYKNSETDLEGMYNRYTYLYDNATDTSLSADLCQLEVTIAWTDKTGEIRSTKYATYIEKR